jgi:hypothetical protein
MTTVLEDGSTIRYSYTIDFPEPPIDQDLPETERNALIDQRRDAIFEAIERLEALIGQTDWANPVVAIGVLPRGYPSH